MVYLGAAVSLTLVIIYLWLAHVMATRAQRKGKSFNVFLAIAFFGSPLLALILIEFARDESVRDGDIVKTIQVTRLDDGTKVERNYIGKVLATKVIEQTPVIQLDGPDRPIWIARDSVRRV